MCRNIISCPLRNAKIAIFYDDAAIIFRSKTINYAAHFDGKDVSKNRCKIFVNRFYASVTCHGRIIIISQIHCNYIFIVLLITSKRNDHQWRCCERCGPWHLCETEDVQEEWVHLIFRSHFGFSTGGCFVVLGTLITTTLIRFVLHATRSIWLWVVVVIL